MPRSGQYLFCMCRGANNQTLIENGLALAISSDGKAKIVNLATCLNTLKSGRPMLQCVPYLVSLFFLLLNTFDAL